MNGSHRAVLPHHSFTVFSLRGFSKKSPAKCFLRGRQVPLTGGRSVCFRGGFMAFFSGSLFASGKKREQIFPAGKPNPADGRARRADPGGFLSFRLVLFLSQKEKEWKKTSGKKREQSRTKRDRNGPAAREAGRRAAVRPAARGISSSRSGSRRTPADARRPGTPRAPWGPRRCSRSCGTASRSCRRARTRGSPPRS